ncbi:hypothetical protein ACFUN8_33040 [Streptomyces sp. NPDC057307]|uniref:hypothetical protein n=1 Tax=Streptomyces sp. NPDC057307 TaxID=3346096 RepID=UPI00362FC3E6
MTRTIHTQMQENGLTPPIVIPPHEIRNVDFGEYENGLLLPILELQQVSIPASVSQSDSRLVNPDGTIHLIVHLQNFGSRSETVQLREL